MNIDLQPSDDTSQVVATSQDVGNDSDISGLAPDGVTNHARWTKLPKPRGRQPKDPHAETLRFTCRETGDQERQLQEYLKAPTAPAEHATLEFVYPVSSAFMVYTGDLRPSRNKQQDEKSQHLYGKLDRSAVSVIDALAQTEDPKEQMRRQKAIAKVCVEACEKVDGFRYSFHNSWLSREDEACRFSYFCNDSTLNKGRAANEGAGMEGKKMRKPVYDCHGTIAVKFSQTKQSLEVHYKHIPMHQTYAERAPPPRKHSKRYRLMEIFEPDKLPPEIVKRPRSSPPVGSDSAKRSQRRSGAEVRIGSEAVTDSRSVSEARTPVVDPGSISHGSTAKVAKDITRRRTASKRTRNALVSGDSSQMHSMPTVHTLSATTISHNMPGTLTPVTSQKPGLIWVEPNQTASAYSRPLLTRADMPLRGIAAAAAASVDESTTEQALVIPPVIGVQSTSMVNAMPMSELEALKAKLEAAEQRIKRLEAEKQATSTTTQPPGWPPHPPPSLFTHPPPPPPSQGPTQHTYPYPYPPQGYHFTHPQGMISAGIHSHPAAPHPPYMGQASPMTQPTQPGYQRFPSPTELTIVQEDVAGRQQGQTSGSRTQGIKAFVAYTPKPQRPLHDAQKQDSARNRPSDNG